MKLIVTQTQSFEAAIAEAVCVQRVLGGHGLAGVYLAEAGSRRDDNIQTVPPG